MAWIKPWHEFCVFGAKIRDDADHTASPEER